MLIYLKFQALNADGGAVSTWNHRLRIMVLVLPSYFEHSAIGESEKAGGEDMDVDHGEKIIAKEDRC